MAEQEDVYFRYRNGGLGDVSKTEAVQEYLYSKLRSGELGPGTRVRQDDLAERLGISSTPVREALNRLRAEGLLTYSAHKGVSVRVPDLDSINEVYNLRTILEGYATNEAGAKLTSDDLEELRVLHQRMANLTGPEHRREFTGLNDEWHWTIYRAAGSSLLMSMVRRLWAASPWDAGMLIPGRSEISLKEHGQIMLALEAREGRRAEKAVRAHLSSYKQSILDALISRPAGVGTSSSS